MAIEQTLILIKPDGAKRKLTGLVIDRLEAAGLQLAGAKMVSVTVEHAREHYRELRDKPFFENLIRYIRGEFHAIPDAGHISHYEQPQVVNPLIVAFLRAAGQP